MDSIRVLDARLFPGCSNEFRSATHWWGVFKGSKLVGYAGLRAAEGDNYVYLCRAGVAVEHRGKGIQKRMIEARLRKGREMGREWAITYTVVSNLASINNLIAKKFRAYHPQTAWAGRKDVIYWRRRLRPGR
jgi:ribosomal protein S18 acetylase RimI-like enzyme